MAQTLKPRKALRVPLLIIQNACMNQLAMSTNLELTSSRILSLLSLNSTSIASTVTPRILSKQKNSIHNSRQDYFLLKSCRQRIVCKEDFFKYTEMSIVPRGKRYFIQSLWLHFAQTVGHSTLRSSSNQYFNIAQGVPGIVFFYL